MRRRDTRVVVHLNEKEQEQLVSQVQKSGLSREAYIRTLISGFIPKSLPPIDYFKMMRELHAIGNNLNQLAAKANTTGHLDRASFQQEADHLRRAVQQIQQAVTAPERRSEMQGNPNALPP